MKTIIIGGSHGGVQTALTLKKAQPDEAVIIYEKEDFISFIASGVNLFLKNIVSELKDAQLFKEEEVAQAGVLLKKQHEVLEINMAASQVFIKNVLTGEEFWDSYDHLVLAMGSTQKSTKMLTCSSKDCVRTYKSYQESQEILQEIDAAETIAIVGAGYIGMELANILYRMNKEVHIIESGATILNRYYEKEIVEPMQAEIRSNSLNLWLNDTVIDVLPLGQNRKLVKTTKHEFSADLVIYAINGHPNTQLLRGQATTLPDHTIKVNEYMQTSKANVYAVGDLVAYPVTNVTGKMYTPLVNETIRTAQVAAMAIAGRPIKYQPNQRTTLTNIFDRNTGSTGMTVRQAVFEGKEVKTSFLKKQWQEAGQVNELSLLLIFQEQDAVLVGAQIIAADPIISVLDYLSLAVNRKVTAEELATMDFSFHPELNLPYHYINEAALQYLLNQTKI